MCDHNGLRLRRDENYFLYHCPSCGLAVLRAETLEGAKRSWRFTNPEPHTAGQASAMEEPGLPTAADELKSPPPDKEDMEACALATEPDCLTDEPLDEPELRIIRILYHRKGDAACIQLSHGLCQTSARWPSAGRERLQGPRIRA